MAISVCMASYNGSRFIKAQLDSILAQLGPEDELIVVDDASSDDTAAIVARCNDERIRLYQQPQNQGHVASFSRAISDACHEFIFLADQDDVWLPGRVAL